MISVIVCGLLSYIIPGWEYLNSHLDALEDHFGKYIPQGILFVFYLSLFCILYMVLFNRLCKDFYITTTNDHQFIVNSKDQREISITKNDLVFNGEKSFSIKGVLNTTLRKHPKGISIKSFEQYVHSADVEKSPENSFSGSILPLSVLYGSLAVGFIIYIAFAIGIYTLLFPHIEALQVLFRARSPLLLMMISIPFLAVFFVVMYYLYHQTVLRKQLIKIDWSGNQIKACKGNKKYVFEKDEVKESTFFINRLTHLSKWLIIERKNGTRYMILCEDEDNIAFQKFINSYVKYFDIDIENASTTIGSASSPLMKKKYTHE
nr:hypothetical protein [uncultured Chryseobacterium sp.]